MALLKTQRPEPSLEDRIKAIQAEIDVHIDSLAKAEVERMGGGVPFGVVRNIIVGRTDGCQCRQYLKVKEQA